MSSSGIKEKSNRFNLFKKIKVMNKRKKLAIILVEIILLISIIPVMALYLIKSMSYTTDNRF